MPQRDPSFVRCLGRERDGVVEGSPFIHVVVNGPNDVYVERKRRTEMVGGRLLARGDRDPHSHLAASSTCPIRP
jgi:hypothetical protein